MRGHNLIWPAHNPDWLVATAPTLSGAQLLAAAKSHINTVVSRYRGQLISWDVVNEPLREPSEGLTTWQAALIGRMKWTGAQPVDWTVMPPFNGRVPLGNGSYIAHALAAAREADGGALLMINEFNVHGGNRKTTLFTSLLADLRQRVRRSTASACSCISRRTMRRSLSPSFGQRFNRTQA